MPKYDAEYEYELAWWMDTMPLPDPPDEDEDGSPTES